MKYTFEDTLHVQEHERQTVSEINRWLPQSIVDSHVHISSSHPASIHMLNDQALVPGETFNFFPWELHARILAEFFPAKKYHAVAFGFPHAPAASNETVLELSASNRRLVPVWLGSAEAEPKTVLAKLRDGFCGLKMYPTRSQKNSSQTRIEDVFPKAVLETVNHLGSAIILHLPKDIFDNLDELVSLARRLPQMTFVIAHMGNIYRYQTGLSEVYRAVAGQANICFDTAMVGDGEVIAEAIAQFGSQRVLFGSDAPFSYIRGCHVGVGSRQTKLLSQFPFSWVNTADHQEHESETRQFRLMHLNIVLAIKRSFNLLALTKNTGEIKTQIFQFNANRVFSRR